MDWKRYGRGLFNAQSRIYLNGMKIQKTPQQGQSLFRREFEPGSSSVQMNSVAVLSAAKTR